MTMPTLLSQAAAPQPSQLGCPWDSLAEYGAPNVKWCEERLCSWIGEPANTWSNLSYLLVALWIFLVLRTLPSRRPTNLRWFAPVVFGVGVCSFIFHASNVFITQMLDFLAMYMFCSLLLVLNLVRLDWLPWYAFSMAFAACVAGMTAITVVVARFGAPIQGLVALMILAIVGTEVRIYRRTIPRYRMRDFLNSLALLFLGSVFSVLDVTRLLCDPQNHFLQGHAIWHVLSAFSLLAAFYHYKQFSSTSGRLPVTPL